MRTVPDEAARLVIKNSFLTVSEEDARAMMASASSFTPLREEGA